MRFTVEFLARIDGAAHRVGMLRRADGSLREYRSQEAAQRAAETWAEAWRAPIPLTAFICTVGSSECLSYGVA